MVDPDYDAVGDGSVGVAGVSIVSRPALDLTAGDVDGCGRVRLNVDGVFVHREAALLDREVNVGVILEIKAGMCGVILIGKVGQADIDAAALSQAGFIPGAIDIEGDVVSAGGLRRGFKGHVLCREGHVIAVHHSDDPGTILGVVIDNDREVLQCEGSIVVDKVEGHLSIDCTHLLLKKFVIPV